MPQPTPARAGTPNARLLLVCFAIVTTASLWIYRGALDGPLVSDDVLNVTSLAKNYQLDARFVADAFDPGGDLRYQNGNYTPLYLLVSRASVAAFGSDTRGYHVLNVLGHALVVTLLFALLARTGVPTAWAASGAALFAVHPANVESVAWISQLRTIAALLLSLWALLAARGRNALNTYGSAALFLAALLFKAVAAFALFAIAAQWWVSRERGARDSVSGRTLVAWLILLAFCTMPQLQAFYAVQEEQHLADPLEHMRSIASIATRYLAMAATSFGTSAFHEPSSPRWSDPWWLAAWPLAGVVAWRIVHSLKARREEAAYWVMAVAAWVPVSQVFPFYFSIADRHLYFMLPGLIGGALLWWHEGRSEHGLRGWLARNRALVGIAVGMAIVFFALRSEDRARLWQDENFLLGDAAGQYPEGGTAHLLRASQAAFAGEFDRAYEELGGVIDTGYYQLRELALDPLLAPLRGQARFEALLQRIARLHIAESDSRGLETQWKLRRLAVSHVQLGQLEQARKVLERALRMGGPVTEKVHADLEVLRELRREQLRARREQSPPAPG